MGAAPRGLLQASANLFPRSLPAAPPPHPYPGTQDLLCVARDSGSLFSAAIFLRPSGQCWGSHVHAKLLQLCLTLYDPMGCSLLGSSVHEILQAKNTGVGCRALLQGICLRQGLNLCLLQRQVDSLPLTHLAAAVAAKSLQSCPTLCDPIDGSPPGSSIPGILQARTLE